MTRARQRVDDAIEGEAVDGAVLRALRVLADETDQVRSSLDRASNRILTIGGSVLATVIATAILLALRAG
jgi:hypothetical protein